VNTYRLGKKDSREEIVEDFSDLGVRRDVLVVLVH